MSMRPASSVPFLALERTPDTGALLGGASSRKQTEELRSKVEKLEFEIAGIKSKIASIDSTVALGNNRNVANMVKQQAKMSSDLEILEFTVMNNRADKRQFVHAVRTIMSHLLLGMLPINVSLEDESLLRDLNIHREFGLTRGDDGDLMSNKPIMGHKIMKSEATPYNVLKSEYYDGWGKKDSQATN